MHKAPQAVAVTTVAFSLIAFAACGDDGSVASPALADASQSDAPAVGSDASNGGGDGSSAPDGAPGLPEAGPPPTFTCTQHVTTSTFVAAFKAAGANTVLCLAPGNYGNWKGGEKTAMVVLTPDLSAGATAPVGNATGGVDGNVIFTVAQFTDASFITMDGITFKDDVSMGGAGTTVHDVTIQTSIFHAHLDINDTAMQNANVVIDYNQFPGDTADCLGGAEGRIHLTNSAHAAVPDGVVIKNNNIGGVKTVQCDGIQSGGYGPQILGNWFHDFHYSGQAHTDGIQLYGSQSTVIKGNFFYNVPDGVVAYDGMKNEDIENNVFVNDSANDNGASPNQFDLLANSGTSTVKHNTVVGGLDTFGGTEGNILTGSKGAACTGLVINDNVATSISNDDGGGHCTFTGDYNLLPQGGGAGTHNLSGSPVYVGGDCGNLTVDPPGKCAGKWANFMLAPTSPGHLAASDGTDIGAYGTGPVTPGGP